MLVIKRSFRQVAGLLRRPCYLKGLLNYHKTELERKLGCFILQHVLSFHQMLDLLERVRADRLAHSRSHKAHFKHERPETRLGLLTLDMNPSRRSPSSWSRDSSFSFPHQFPRASRLSGWLTASHRATRVKTLRLDQSQDEVSPRGHKLCFIFHVPLQEKQKKKKTL